MILIITCISLLMLPIRSRSHRTDWADRSLPFTGVLSWGGSGEMVGLLDWDVGTPWNWINQSESTVVT